MGPACSNLRCIAALILFLFIAPLSVFSSGNELKGEGLKKVRILSLEECIKKGLENYQEIKAAQWDKVWAEAKLSEAKAARYVPKFTMTNLIGPVPALGAGYGPPNFPEHDIDWGKWTFFYRASFDLIQPLFTFGKIQSAVNAATAGAKAKELEVAVKKRELVNKIRKTYYGMALGYAGLDLLDEMKDKMESAKKRVENLLRRGSSEVTDIDLFKLRVFESDMESRYLTTNAGIDIAKRALMVLMGEEPHDGIDIEDKDLKPYPAQLKQAEDYYEIAKNHREEIKQMSEVIKIKKAQIDMAKSEFYPSLFLGATFKYSISPGREEANNPYLKDDFNDKVAGIALGLNQNLSFALTSTRYKQAKAEYSKLLSENDMVTNGVLLEVRKSYEEAVSRQELIEITKKGFKQGRSWLTSAYLSFDMGTVDTTKLIEAFVAYTKTKMEYYNAIFNFNLSLSDLSASTGVDTMGHVY